MQTAESILISDSRNLGKLQRGLLKVISFTFYRFYFTKMTRRIHDWWLFHPKEEPDEESNYTKSVNEDEE